MIAHFLRKRQHETCRVGDGRRKHLYAHLVSFEAAATFAMVYNTDEKGGSGKNRRERDMRERKKKERKRFTVT